MSFISNRNSMFRNWFSYLKTGATFFIICAFSWAQDPEPPEEFEFNISIYQSFYFFLESDIDGEDLIFEEDWIASFNIYDETYGGLCLSIDESIIIDYDESGDPIEYGCQDLNNDGALTIDAEICVG